MTNPILPLFPLNSVLFPDGILALRVFELRYLNMVRRCIAEGTGFGVVPLRGGSEVRLPGRQETLGDCGAVATVIESSAPQPALLQIVCRGGSRFRVLAAEQMKDGLWTAQIETVADDQLVHIPSELKDTADALEGLIAALERDKNVLDQRIIGAPYRRQECGWVANRWCELLPLDTSQKMRLLMLDNPLLRLELVQDILEQRQILPRRGKRPPR
jgi:Lon protease-like protein